MSKHVLSVLGAVILTLALAAVALAQVTTTTVTKTVQNPDGTYTVIEYPAKKEIQINLTPVNITGATGVATILRDDDGTRIKLNLASVPADVTAMTLYAVDDKGVVTALGPVAISNGVGTYAGTTPLSSKFMLVASAEPALTAYDANTKVFFRSAVPEGYAVIPVTTNPSGEKVAAVAAPTTAPTTVVTAPTAPTTAPTTVITTPAPTAAPTTVVTAPAGTAVVTQTSYPAPMLGIPGYKKGDDTKIKVDFSGALAGARANVFVTPRKDGPTEVKMRFHDLKEAPQGQSFILWAVAPDGKYVKLGQVANTPGRNEAEIKSETTLPDFGLLVTMESALGEIPAGPAVAHIHIVP